MVIHKVTDHAFRKYGCLHKQYNVSDLVKTMENTPLPEAVIYEPSDEKLENLPVYAEMMSGIYGGLPIQIGYCNGHNNKLNAFEYHRSSEINVAVTDMILILGMEQDITDESTYDTSKADAFFVPSGTVVEMYATTLHYAPCGVDGKGFRCVVVLPRDTNLALQVIPNITLEDKLLMARNKWLIAHKEACIEGAFNGLIGENLTI